VIFNADTHGRNRSARTFFHDSKISRLTADGMWYLCLYASEGMDLRKALRSGMPLAEISGMIRSVWQRRGDRGAEARLAGSSRSPLIPLDRLRRDPHLEMHTRGG